MSLRLGSQGVLCREGNITIYNLLRVPSAARQPGSQDGKDIKHCLIISLGFDQRISSESGLRGLPLLLVRQI